MIFLGRQLLKQFEKQTADPKTADIMPRAKNAETESEVMYALKQINARLAILDNYIRENPDDPEIDRWVAVKLQYMDIRDSLAKKRLHKRNYGIFVDYDALDKLDDENSDEE